jgi:hypothetical protein
MPVLIQFEFSEKVLRPHRSRRRKPAGKFKLHRYQNLFRMFDRMAKLYNSGLR